VIEVKGSAGPIAVDDGGTGEPPCLLVHSLGGRLAFWASTLAELRRNHRAVALDLRSHGASAPAPFAASGLDDFADDVLRAADALGLARFVLVGHSFGATVALAVAARVPGRVLALALVDAAGAFDQVPASTLEAYIDTVLQDETGAFVRAAYEANLERATPGTREAVLASLAATGRATLAGAYTAMFATDARKLLLRYPGPVRLIVDAANDSPMSLHAQHQDLDVIPIEGTSHWINLDQPHALADAILGPVNSKRGSE
jgi:pimeloyl-ACP methyl ester carboxylesterase